MTTLSERVAELRGTPKARIEQLDVILEVHSPYMGARVNFFTREQALAAMLALDADHARLVEQLAQADKHLAEMISLVKRFVALPSGAWHPERHAAEEMELVEEAHAAIDAIPAEIRGRIGG